MISYDETNKENTNTKKTGLIMVSTRNRYKDVLQYVDNHPDMFVREKDTHEATIMFKDYPHITATVVRGGMYLALFGWDSSTATHTHIVYSPLASSIRKTLRDMLEEERQMDIASGVIV